MIHWTTTHSERPTVGGKNSRLGGVAGSLTGAQALPTPGRNLVARREQPENNDYCVQELNVRAAQASYHELVPDLQALMMSTHSNDSNECR